MDTTKRRALGKGLEELFNNEQLDFNKIEEKIIDSTPKEEIVEVNLDELRSNPYQPRKVFDEEKNQRILRRFERSQFVEPMNRGGGNTDIIIPNTYLILLFVFKPFIM